MFKRSQQAVSDSSKHWYQDKYQQVLTQRNILALLAIVALLIAAMAVLAVMRLAPLKTVEPYLLTIDDKTGITARVNPVERGQYSAFESVDRYFTAAYVRMYEGYNLGTLVQNYETIRLMSTKPIFANYRAAIDASNPESVTKRLGAGGQRDVKIRSMAYLPNATAGNSKTIQAHVVTTETGTNADGAPKYWVITVTFEYAELDLNEEERWINPLGYTVTRYQVQSEID